MKKLTKKRICSYDPNIGTGAAVYAYETQSAYQDNTRVHQPTPEQIQRMNQARARNEAHAGAVGDIIVTTGLAAGAGGAVGAKFGGAAGAAAGAASAAAATVVVETYNTCTSCHKKD